MATGMTGRILLSIGLVYATFFVVTFAVYGTGAEVAGLELPKPAEPAVFMASVFLEKLGHAIAFVGLYYFGRAALRDRWLAYATVWWAMFVIAEAAMAIRSEGSWPNAIAGMIAETIYFPLAALLTRRVLTPATA
jgi:hypothetical protein